MALTPKTKRTVPVHHKKRTGEHHKHSKHYLKTYYPYLPLLLIVLVGLAINFIWTSHGQVLGASTNMTSTQLLADTNKDRETAGQEDLRLSSKLSTAAQAKANDMVAKNYWSHTAPNGKTPWNFITASGYQYFSAGENLAYGFPNAETAVEGWMNSAEHRANLLNSSFTEVGFGIAPAKNFQGHGATTVIVAMYAEPSVGLPAGATTSVSTDQPSDIPMRNIARIQMLTHGQAPWSMALVSFIALIAAFWFLYRHFKIWKRVVVESEEFMMHHKLLDTCIVFVAVTGFVLTRAAGFIH